jgi:hypothetical protein
MLRNMWDTIQNKDLPKSRSERRQLARHQSTGTGVYSRVNERSITIYNKNALRNLFLDEFSSLPRCKHTAAPR